MEEITALKREADGILSRIILFQSDVGLHTDPMAAEYETEALESTGVSEELRGWGVLDGMATVCRTSADIEILVPITAINRL